jgi:peptide/nickel transport system substrate-binding protein
MENRFGVKDLVLFGLVAALAVVVLLAMVQFNRHWDVVQQIKGRVDEQTADLAYIRQRLQAATAGGGGSGGAAATQPGGGGMAALLGPGGGANLDADLRVRKLHDAPDYAPGGAVVDVLASLPNRLTPIVDPDLYGARIQVNLFDTLAERDSITLDWRPRLAKRWTVSADGRTIDFELRPGVVFSNGDPLTADDVVFTMDMTLDPKIEAPGSRAILDKLDKVTKTSDLGVRFTFKEPYFRTFEVAALTQVICKKFYSRYSPEQFNTLAGLVMGSGPYRMPDPEGWKPEPGKPIELVRNERYWGEPSGPDKLVWRLIEQPSSRMTALRNGELDVYGDMNPVQFDDLTKDPELTKRVRPLAMQSINYGYTFVGWNQKRNGKPTPFADARVRRAMSMLIDRSAIAREMYRGRATLVSGPFHPLSPMSDPSVQPWPYDPPQAERLLAEAGYKRQGGGLVGPDGQPFKFELMHTNTSETAKRTARFVQDAMARAGIACEPLPTEWNVMDTRMKERQFDALMMGWSGGGVEDDPFQMYSAMAAEGAGQNYVQHVNPALDAAMNAARTQLDEAKRMPLWHAVHRILHEDEPYTYMVADWELVAVANKYKGVEETKLGTTPRTEWYIPRGTPR